MNHSKSAIRTIAEALAQEIRPEALALGNAVVVGNRAGVVEWTSDAWSRLTGFPLSETLDKPITHFLACAGLELELVDFVAQNFLAGRSSTVELPFETFDQRRIEVHLEVEPLRDANGEISRFIAVASDISARKVAETSLPTSPLDTEKPGLEAARSTTASDASVPFCTALQGGEGLCLLDVADRVIRRVNAETADHIIFDSELAADVPKIHIDPIRFEALMESLFDAVVAGVDENPTFITVLTGRLDSGLSHRSRVHPVPTRAIASGGERQTYLEIHDTRPHLDHAALMRVRDNEHPHTPREHALQFATQLAVADGLSLLIDSTPGCGNQLLLVIPDVDENLGPNEA